MSEVDGAVAEDVTRRRLMRAAASGSGTATVGPAFVAAASGQREVAVATRATVASDAAALGRDYTGLLVHLVDRSESADAEAVERCRRLVDEANVRQYETVFVDNAENATRTAGVDLVVAERPGVDVGSLFVVESQRRDVGHVQLRLERVSASRADPPEAGGSDEPESRTVAESVSGVRKAATSGLGAVTTLVGLGAALYVYGRRSRER